MVVKSKFHIYDRPSTYYAFYATFGLVVYFLWCDLSFFGLLAAETTEEVKLKNSTLTSKYTVKLRMTCHFDHYLYLPISRWTNEYFKISEIPWVSPNVITMIHFILAMISGRLIGSNLLYIRRIGAALFEVRSMLDDMDGVVYRAQVKSKAFVPGWGTSGFMIDGIADTVGSLFMMVGTLYRLNKHLPLKNPSSLLRKYRPSDVDVESVGKRLLSDDECAADVAKEYGLEHHPRPYVNFIFVYTALSVIVRSWMWDHFLHGYYTLLDVRRPDISPEKQLAALNYPSTWFCIWLWKFHSADAWLSYTLIAIFFNRLWEWTRFSAYMSIPNMVIFGLICQVHLMHLRNLLGVSH